LGGKGKSGENGNQYFVRNELSFASISHARFDFVSFYFVEQAEEGEEKRKYLRHVFG
jgi:hypothetical protein